MHGVILATPLDTSPQVESFEQGDHITSYIESQNNPYNHRLSEMGSGLMLQMMLVDNLIHSDLHPGNILVRLNPPSGLVGALYKGIGKIKESSMVRKAAAVPSFTRCFCSKPPRCRFKGEQEHQGPASQPAAEMAAASDGRARRPKGTHVGGGPAGWARPIPG